MNKWETNIILEGNDDVCKTSTIKKLKEQGIEGKDSISKCMLFTVSLEEGVNAYEKYFKETNDKIVFFVNNDSEKLMKRIYSREVISNFDLEALQYNELYLNIYNYIKENNKLYGKLFLEDCANLTLEHHVKKVKEIINA